METTLNEHASSPGGGDVDATGWDLPQTVLIAPSTRIATGLFLGQSPLFRRFRKCHVSAIDTQYSASVDCAFEPAERTVNGFVIANFNTYGHCFRLFLDQLYILFRA